MSLITTPPTVDKTAQKVARILATPNQIYSTLFAQWQQSIQAIWNDPNPQAIWTALGTNGPTLVQYSVSLAAFLESQVPGCTVPVLSKIPPFSIVGGVVVVATGSSSSSS